MIFNQFVGGGNKPVLLVTVTGQTATSVVASKSGTIVSLTYDSTLGKWWAFLPSTGTWTVTASGSVGNTKSVSVSAVSVSVYEASLQLSRLPNGYTELEYIESGSTTCYIDTGLTVENGFLATGAFTIPSIPTDRYACFFGCQDNTPKRLLFSPSRGDGKSSLWPPTGKNYKSSENIPINAKTTFEINLIQTQATPSLLINGVSQTLTQTSSTGTSGCPNFPIYLFGDCANGSFSEPLAANSKFHGDLIFYADVTKQTELARICPAKRDSDSVIGMYDVVRNQFFTNAGTGSFIGGPEV